MSNLACQFMDVMYIPNELDDIIQKKSHGIASWCEQLIKDMLMSNIIQIVPECQAFLTEEVMKEETSTEATDLNMEMSITNATLQDEFGAVTRPLTPFYRKESGIEKDVYQGARSPGSRRSSLPVSKELAVNALSLSLQESEDMRPKRERRRSTGAGKSIRFNLGNREDLESFEVDGSSSRHHPLEIEAESIKSSRRSSVVSKEINLNENVKFQMDRSNFVQATENSMPLDTKKVCIISPGVDISKVVVPESVKDMVLARIDRMMPLEQVTLKCASILGGEFHRNVLEAILPKSNRGNIDLVLYNLAKESILECASLAAQHQNAHNHHGFYDFNDPVHGHQHGHHHHHHHHHNVASSIHASVYCGCHADEMTKVLNLSRLMTPTGPKKQCLYLKFVNTYVQETAYSLWLEDQRKDLHERAAMFLESQAHKCNSCGGGGFVPHQIEPREGSRAPGQKRVSGKRDNRCNFCVVYENYMLDRKIF